MRPTVLYTVPYFFLWFIPVAVLAAATASPLRAFEANIPVLVPLTGFLSLEGTSQRNGALLALENPPENVTVKFGVADTSTAPENAVTALERAVSRGKVSAVVASMLGTQMLAMLPLAIEYGIPLVTMSGTASITEMGNPWIFRFFPGDAITKVAHARYTVEELGKRRPAIVYQTTAYGQSGRRHLSEALNELGVQPVYEEGINTAVKDMLPLISKIRRSMPDILLLHLHAGPTALFIKQARAAGINIPIVAGSAMHQPSTAALLEPTELGGVCAESGSSPISGGNTGIEQFTKDYRERFGSEPDAFALGQYDATVMVLAAVASGATTPDDIRRYLSETHYQGLAMEYFSDGKGNMAHDAVIICYGGADRRPEIVKTYRALDSAK
jgi:branched-chain amino acid transport system substrate-binding protein